VQVPFTAPYLKVQAHFSKSHFQYRFTKLKHRKEDEMNWNYSDHEESCNDRAMSYALPKQYCSGCSGSYNKRRRDALQWLSGQLSENEIEVVCQILAKKKASNVDNKTVR
jgi:hypothetical protein